MQRCKQYWPIVGHVFSSTSVPNEQYSPQKPEGCVFMTDQEKNLERAEAILTLIRQLPDPIACASSFRKSWQAFKKESQITEFVAGCRELVEALRLLEINPSTFLYQIPSEPLDELSDMELNDPQNRKAIIDSIRDYEADFNQVLKAFDPIEKHAY